MVGKVALVVTCLALSLAGGCRSESDGGRPAPTASATASAAPGGACGLIEASEIAAVQGAQVRGTTPNDRPGGRFAVSQCYYAVSSDDGLKNLSVHLEVTRGKGDASLKEYWEERFAREGGEEREKGGEGREGPRGAEEEESAPPQRVEGIGEEAFWLGSPRVGALYVLKGDRVVRISVGGSDDTRTKIEKSKRLAAFALKRLT